MTRHWERRRPRRHLRRESLDRKEWPRHAGSLPWERRRLAGSPARRHLRSGKPRPIRLAESRGTREKDKAHREILRRFIEEEIVEAFRRETEPRKRLRPVRRYLEVTGDESISEPLASRLLPLARTEADFRFLIGRARLRVRVRGAAPRPARRDVPRRARRDPAKARALTTGFNGRSAPQLIRFSGGLGGPEQSVAAFLGAQASRLHLAIATVERRLDRRSPRGPLRALSWERRRPACIFGSPTSNGDSAFDVLQVPRERRRLWRMLRYPRKQRRRLP